MNRLVQTSQAQPSKWHRIRNRLVRRKNNITEQCVKHKEHTWMSKEGKTESTTYRRKWNLDKRWPVCSQNTIDKTKPNPRKGRGNLHEKVVQQEWSKASK